MSIWTRAVVFLVSTASVLALSAETARPASESEQACAAQKIRAAKRYASAMLGCVARALENGEPINGEPFGFHCLAPADSDFFQAFARAESGGSCSTAGDVGEIEREVQRFVDRVTRKLRPPAEWFCCVGGSAVGVAGSAIGCGWELAVSAPQDSYWKAFCERDRFEAGAGGVVVPGRCAEVCAQNSFCCRYGVSSSGAACQATTYFHDFDGHAADTLAWLVCTGLTIGGVAEPGRCPENTSLRACIRWR